MTRPREAPPEEDLVAKSLALGCEVTMLAHDAAEADRFRSLIKGRHGAARVSVRIARPEEFTPAMDIARRGAGRKPEPAPAVVDDLDYDGY